MEVESQLDWTRRQLRRYSKHGWRMTLEPGSAPEDPGVLVVRYQAEDSRNPGRQIDLMARRHLGPYPACDEQWFATDLRRTLLHGVYGHELDETLYRDGRLLNDPHADPALARCTRCGASGGQRDGRQYACPGCGGVMR